MTGYFVVPATPVVLVAMEKQLIPPANGVICSTAADSTIVC